MQRIMCVASVFFVPMFGVLDLWFVPDDINPWAPRLFVTAFATAVGVASFWAPFRRWMRPAAFLAAALLFLWVVDLAAVNQFPGNRVLGVVLVHLCLGYVFLSVPLSVALHAFVLLVIAVYSAITPEPHIIDGPILGAVSLTVAFVGVLSTMRQLQLLTQLEQGRQMLESRVQERTRELTLEVTERRAAQERASEANQAKSRFLANMSHELRTPLNAVVGYGELMVEDLEDTGTVERTDLLHVLTSSRHLLAMINDVLDLAKVETGDWQPDADPVDLSEVVQGAVTQVRPLADTQGTEIRVDVEEGLPPMLADRRRLTQILVNLVGNAAKFTEQGTIQVSLWRASDSDLMMAVADTGVGIPKDQQAQIFEKFVQLEDSGNRKHRGTGLGLSLVREMVESFGGTVRLDSAMGQGSTFTVRLPWCAPAERTDASGQSAAVR